MAELRPLIVVLGDRFDLEAATLEGFPARWVPTAPGDGRVLQQVKAVAEAGDLPLDVCEDRRCFMTVSEFAAHAEGRRSLRVARLHRQLQRRRCRGRMDDRRCGSFAQWWRRSARGLDPAAGLLARNEGPAC